MLSLKVTPEQNTFFDFIALKILNGLSDNLKRLYPSEKEMITLLKRYKRNVKVFRRKYQYALRPTELEELLFIAK